MLNKLQIDLLSSALLSTLYTSLVWGGDVDQSGDQTIDTADRSDG